MREIQLNPQKFTFPNFCFEKKFKNYLFLDSGILATGSEPQAYFFRILKALELEVPNNSSEDLIWDLLIPYTFEAEWGNWKGEKGTWKISKELKKSTLSELHDYFNSFPESFLKSNFIELADKFWIGLKEIICVYALYNGEIIVIGADLNYKLEELKEIHVFPAHKVGGIRIIGEPLYVKERRVDFFYNSFDEYVDHWGPIFKWDKKKIEFLKIEFSG